MLIVGVKKVIVDDVIVVDEEFEIDSKYFNFLFLKLDLNIEKGFLCIGNGMCVILNIFVVVLEDMDVVIVIMFFRFVLDEFLEFGRMLDDFWLCVLFNELVVFINGIVIDFWWRMLDDDVWFELDIRIICLNELYNFKWIDYSIL